MEVSADWMQAAVQHRYTSTMKPSQVKKLGAAVLHWLSFQRLCGRSALMSEHYLSQPIGEFLIHHHSGTLESEVNHPNLSIGLKRGRPRQIDFCLHSRVKKRMTAAFELKWISSKSSGKQQIIDDVLRLEALRIDERQPVQRYFLVAGWSGPIRNKFRNAEANIGGGAGRVKFFPEIFEFRSDSEKVVRTLGLNDPQRKAFDTFSKDYKSKLPLSFVTECIYGEHNGGFGVYIWRIRSVQNRAFLA